MKKTLLIGIAMLALVPEPASAASGLGTFLPPPEFDKPYTGILTIQRLATERDVQDICPTVNFKAFTKRGHAIACSIPRKDHSQCDVFIVGDQVLTVTGHNYVLALRHELGHCNGWLQDHKGGIKVPIETRASGIHKIPIGISAGCLHNT